MAQLTKKQMQDIEMLAMQINLAETILQNEGVCLEYRAARWVEARIRKRLGLKIPKFVTQQADIYEGIVGRDGK